MSDIILLAEGLDADLRVGVCSDICDFFANSTDSMAGHDEYIDLTDR
jgi:hypothetical protein